MSDLSKAMKIKLYIINYHIISILYIIAKHSEFYTGRFGLIPYKQKKLKFFLSIWDEFSLSEFIRVYY